MVERLRRPGQIPLHTIHTNADLLSEGRYADEVMKVLADSGRNEPCPCGSGRKSKVCHQLPR